MYQRLFGMRESPLNVNPDPLYLFLTRQVPAHLVEEMACEFQLDEIVPRSPVGIASMAERVASTEALLQNLDELLGCLHRINNVSTISREGKP